MNWIAFYSINLQGKWRQANKLREEKKQHCDRFFFFVCKENGQKCVRGTEKKMHMHITKVSSIAKICIPLQTNSNDKMQWNAHKYKTKR